MKKAFTPDSQNFDFRIHQNPTFIKVLLSFFFIAFSNLAFSQVVVTKAVDKTTADIGSPVTYTLNINCPSTTGSCVNAVVTDPLPANMEYIGASPATGNVQSITYNAGTNTVTIQMKSPLNGTTDQVTLVTAFKQGTFTGATANNIAYGGPGLTNPSNTVTTTATNGANPPTFTDQVDIIKNHAGNATASPNGGMGFNFIWFNESATLSMNNFVFEDIMPSNFILDTFSDVVNNVAGSSITYNVYYKTSNNSTYTLWPGSPFDMTGGYHNTGQISLASGERVTALKWEYLNPIPGGGSFYPWMGNNWGALYGTIDATATPNVDVVNNCITGTGKWSNNNNLNIAYNYDVNNTTSACVSVPVTEPKLITLTEKALNPAKPGYLAGDDISFKIFYGHTGNSNLDIVNPIITDVLPPELEFVNATVQEEWGDPFVSTGTPIPAGTPTTITNNYNGTGQTLLRWNFNGITIPKKEIGGGRIFSIIVNAKVKAGVSTGVYKNKPYFYSTTIGEPTCINWDGWAGSGNENNYLRVVDANDLNGNGLTTDSLCTAFRNFNIIFPAGAGLESIKWVKGTCDAEYTRYPASGKTVPGGQADYLLKVKNLGNVAMKDVKIIDILPFVGDKGVIDLSNRNTEWRPFLIAPVKTIPSNPNVTIYYSTAQNPCRDELTPGIPSPCENPNWTTSLPSDVTTVQSLKFDFGSLVLQPGDSVLLEWAMRAPVDAPTNGEIAWNSFGYITARNDNGSFLLPSEPIKVGIAVKPTSPGGYGNYVWKDENKNGLQDEAAASGINGVKVDLYWAKGGTPNMATDSLVSFTLTSDKNGNPGFYQFTNLNPGNYYAVFHKPINDCVVTLPNIASPSDSLDSDGVQLIMGADTLAITAIAPIGASQYDYTWDMGFAPKIVLCTPPTAVTAGSNSPVAEGGSINLTSTSTGGTAYSWSGPNGFTSTTQNPSIASATTLMAGTYTVTVLSSGTCTATATTAVVVNVTPTCTPPTAVTAGSNSPVEEGSSINLTSSSTGGTSYSWSGPNGFASTSQNPSIAFASLTASGTYTVTILSSGTCTATATTQVVVYNLFKPLPVCNPAIVVSASSNSPINLGGAITLTSISPTAIDFAWTGPNNFTSTSQNPTISNATASDVGTYTVIVTENGECATTATTAVILACTPPTAVTASSNSPVAEGSSINLTSTSTGGTTYSWAGPNSFTSTTQNPTIASATATMAGVYTVTVLSSGTCTATATVLVEIKQFGSIGDYVWTDSNNDGQQDGTESPISGVKVYLLNGTTGAKLDSTLTDATGKYLFDSLLTGSYKVQFVAPAGTIAAKQNTGADVTDSDANSAGLSQLINIDVTKLPTDTLRNNPQIDAGFVPVGSLGDYVFNDKDSDGVQDATDTPISGIKVYLLDATTGAKLDSTLTDALGKYTFDSLLAGTYKVQFVLPTGSEATGKTLGGDTTKDSNINPDGTTDAVTIDTTLPVGDVGRNNPTIDAGIKSAYGSIGDYVWTDSNNDGQQDGTESPISGVKVYLLNGTTGAKLDSTLTDATGKYLFDSLLTGSYQVKFVAPLGTIAAKQNTGADVTDSDANSAGLSQLINIDVTKLPTDTLRNNPQIDAGFVPVGSLGDYVFNDKDSDGVQDATDTPISGIKVYLLDATTGAKLDSTLTDALGKYTFDSLLAGTYKVQFVLPTGSEATGKTLGGDTTKDSNINPDGTTDAVTIDTTLPVGDVGRNNPTIDAGIKSAYGSIGDYVWTDSNNDGQQDGTESPISGVKVYLLNGTTGAKLDSTLTDATGKYLFDSLLTGSYKVQFVAPAGTIAAKQNTGADVTDSDANSAGLSQLINIDVTKLPTDTLRNNPQIDAGFVPVGSLGDYVFNDKDNSNTQTVGDLAVSGVKVYLLDATTGAKLDSTVTDGAGKYLFDSLVAGNYKVQFVAPVGTILVTKNTGTDATKDSNPNVATGITDVVTIDTTQPIGSPLRDNRDVDAGVQASVIECQPTICVPYTIRKIRTE